MNKNDIVKFAKDNGYETAEFNGQWREYDVYKPVYNSKNICMIGLPYIILVKDNKIRMSTEKECFDYIKSLSEAEDD